LWRRHAFRSITRKLLQVAAARPQWNAQVPPPSRLLCPKRRSVSKSRSAHGLIESSPQSRQQMRQTAEINE
jgi:hypothetical protein